MFLEDKLKTNYLSPIFNIEQIAQTEYSHALVKNHSRIFYLYQQLVSSKIFKSLRIGNNLPRYSIDS
jgi:hypothetical protein